MTTILLAYFAGILLGGLGFWLILLPVIFHLAFEVPVITAMRVQVQLLGRWLS